MKHTARNGRHEARKMNATYCMLPVSRGFTLVELLVTLVVFGAVTVFVLLIYSRVSSQLKTTALAYEVALSLREAQNYGVSVREFRSGSAATFDAAYGLHFDTGSDARFVLFSDARRDERGVMNLFYDGDNDNGCIGSAGSECVSVYKIGRGNRIYKFCGVLPTDGGRDAAPEQKREECSRESTPPSNPSPTVTYLDIMFKRPNPDAVIRTNRSGGTERYKAARIYLVSGTGESRVVEAVNTGQISVK